MRIFRMCIIGIGINDEFVRQVLATPYTPLRSDMLAPRNRNSNGCQVAPGRPSYR